MQQATAKTKTKGKAMTTMTNGQVTAPTARPLPAINDAVPEKLISKRHVARRVGKSIRTVDHWMQRGLVPYYKIGRTVSFRWSEVERRLAEFQVSGSAQAKLPRQ
jgi:predicted DNA-binding transcriptional regulator AlpA